MKKIYFSNRGFTLVELMVSIGIMALLTGIIMANLTSSRAKARDAKRISDVGQIQLALELYFDRCNEYPSVVGSGVDVNGTQTINTTSSCTTSGGSTVNISTFLNPIPTPPGVTTQTVYIYAVNPARTDYVVMTQLEGYSETLKDDVDGVPLGGVNCGTAGNGQGTSELLYCVTPQ